MKDLFAFRSMRSSLLWLLLIVAIAGVCEAQTKSIQKKSSNRKFHVRIQMINDQVVKGVVRSIGPETVYLETIKSSRRTLIPEAYILENGLHYSEIRVIKFRSVSAALGGFAAGVLGGFVVGGAYGYITCNDCDDDNREGNAVAFAFLGGILGGPIGASVGPPSFYIKGQHGAFQRLRSKMKKKGVNVE